MLYQMLRWAGVAYLLWLAWEGWHQSGAPETAGAEDIPEDVTFFLRGLMTNLLNPKAALFYVAVLPGFVDETRPVIAQTVWLSVIFVLIAIASGIVNFIKERKAAAEREGMKAGGWQGGNADRELRSEIDVFLQEVSPDDAAESRPSRSQQQRRRQAISDEEAERRRELRARRERERRQRKAKQQRQSTSKRKTGAGDLDGVSSRHVESSVENRHLQSHIAGSADSDLLSQRGSQDQEASRISALLHQPDGI